MENLIERTQYLEQLKSFKDMKLISCIRYQTLREIYVVRYILRLFETAGNRG